MTLPRTAALAVVALAVAAAGADSPPQTIEADGLTFEVPAAWKKEKPTNAMRKAQLKVEPAKGDTDSAELTVFAFPNGGGTVEQNIGRWQDQFRDKDGNSSKAETEKKKGKNVEVTRVELSGTYKDPFSKAGSKSGYRLLGAIAEGNQSAYFIKLIGPDKTVKEAKSAFDDLIKSMKLDE